jgi:hypothetical protein
MAAPPRPAFVVWNPLTTSIYDSITEYLSSPDRDAGSAAAELTSLMTPYMSSTSDIQNVCHLWGVIFFMATTYHPSSPRHSLLLDLVLEIRKCSAPPFPGRLAYEKQGGCSFWEDLPIWRAVWNDYEFDAPLVPRMGERKSDGSLLENQFLPGPWRNRDGGPMVSIAWASLNAFGARLHAQTDLALLDVRALFALMEALEDERSARALDDVVPAAACKITVEPITSCPVYCGASEESIPDIFASRIPRNSVSTSYPATSQTFQEEYMLIPGCHRLDIVCRKENKRQSCRL